MSDIDLCVGLPEGIAAHELRPHFVRLIESFRQESVAPEVNAILERLDELADRQWHTYEPLDQELHSEVERMLITLLTTSISMEEAEHVVSIVARLGFPNALGRLSKLATTVSSSAVREEIEESVRELADSVTDPYSGLRDFK